jgi:hypothetical protein
MRTASLRSAFGGGLLALSLVGGGLTVWAGPSGAIFTTNAEGTWVNGNVYDNKAQVYLNGGPKPNAPCTAAGLPDGEYYFQVTDPSGSTLLSADSDLVVGIEERRVIVSGGVIVNVGPVSTHPPGDAEVQCGSTTVPIAPFNDTPNPGGEYKVWMTHVQDFMPGGGAFGFLPSKSKTDNFKVSPPEGSPD